MLFDPSVIEPIRKNLLDRVLPPFGRDHRAVAQIGRDRRDIERRRHHDDAQLGAQRALDLPAEREREVGVNRALVELVEDHRADAVEGRVVLQPTNKQALRHDDDAGLVARAVLETNAIADFTA